MEPSDLELYTIQELITELVRRKTFLGVVVHSEQELKAEPWSGERLFKVHHNRNLTTTEAGRLLDLVSQHVENEGE